MPFAAARFAVFVSFATSVAAEPSFVDVTDASGIDFVHQLGSPMPGYLFNEVNRFGTGAAVGDYDRDGDLDVFLANAGGAPCALYRNDGDGSFSEVAAAAGVAARLWARVPLFVDLNGDGWDDLVVAADADGRNQHLYTRVFENLRNGTFADRSVGSGVDFVGVVVGGVTAGDVDADGDLDLYITSWLGQTNALYRNDGDFRFSDITALAGLDLGGEFVPQWSPVFADFDDDGFVDLFGAVDFAPDYLFMNDGDGTFTRLDQEMSVNNDMGAAVADFDNDGDLDVYTTNISDPGSEACCNWLYVNEGDGRFTNEAVERGVVNSAWGWGTAFLDAELDGDLDIVAVNGWQQPEWVTAASFFVNDGTGHFTENAAAAGLDYVANSRGLVPFDMDRDGDVDLLITDHEGPVALFENVSDRGANRWLTVQAPVGCRVEVTDGETTWTSEVLAGGSYYGSAAPEVHLGVGEATVVDVSVRRRDGTTWVTTTGTNGVVTVPADLVAVPGEPLESRLAVWPNPFRSEVSFGTEGGIRVFDTRGRLVFTGDAARWDGRDRADRPIPPGVYTVIAAGGSPTKLVRLR